MASVTMTLEEYKALISMIRAEPGVATVSQDNMDQPKPKKRNTAYQRKYKRAFRKISKRYKTKSGKWKKGGFKAAVRAAHKEAKR